MFDVSGLHYEGTMETNQVEAEICTKEAAEINSVAEISAESSGSETDPEEKMPTEPENIISKK